jgi:putative ABC transport system permease protein
MGLALAWTMKQAIRSLLRTPGFFVVVVLTLAAGIGANTAIFSVVRGILLRPLPYPEPERLVALHNRTVDRTGGPLSVLGLVDVRAQLGDRATIGAYTTGSANLTGDGAPERLSVGFATGDFFAALGVKPAAGRLIQRGEDEPGQPRVAVLSHDLWQRRFGADPALIGKDLVLNDKLFRVVGVLPASFVLEAGLDLYVPLIIPPEDRAPATRDQHFLHPVARMHGELTLEALNAELAVVGERARRDHPNIYGAESAWRPEARPLLDRLVADVRPSLWLLTVAAALVLLIVCGNVASLLLARAATRHRELSVRAALGASRRRLAAQLLGEGLILSAFGGVLGVLLALWGTDLLLSLAPDGLPRVDEIRVDGAVLAFSLLVTVVSGALFGLVPALGASRVDLQEALRAGGRAASAGRRPRRVRRVLVVAETALALVLVTGAALVARSFARVMSVEPGFRTDVLSLRLTLPKATPAWFEDARARIAALPGVTHAGATHHLPFRDGFSDRLLDVESAPELSGSRRPAGEFRIVTPGYLETMGIPVVAGRAVEAGDGAGAQPVAVVSRGLARALWADADPLGQKIRLSSPQGPWMTVVGVAGDVHDVGLDVPPSPTFYVPAAQHPGPGAFAFVVRGELPPAHLAGLVRAELSRFDARAPVHDVRPMSERIAHAVEQRRFVLILFELFAGLALALAALGLYGLLAQAVADRQREIGVRVALGATRAGVLALVAREGAALVGLGIALGVAGGLAGTRVLRHLLYETSPADPLSLLAAVGLLALASALAVALPAARALRVDPMEALRDE